MAQSASSNLPYGGEYPRLSQEQQNLLLQALISRNQQGNLSDATLLNGANHQAQINDASLSVNPSFLDTSTAGATTAPTRGSGYGGAMFPTFSSGLLQSDPEYNIDLSNTDLGFGDSYATLPASGLDSDALEHEKRKKSPDEEEDDEDESDGENSPKRRENEDKTAKKPGRKPLTTEPTTKRKAQNRAAQRAFRERKEKHLKDLEQKVVDLEKASESANHENGLLRAQVDRLHSELREYRKRLSLNGAGAGAGVNRTSISSTNMGFPDPTNGFSGFQFDFTKFGNASTAQSFDSSLRASSSPSVNANGNDAAQNGTHGLSPQNSNGATNIASSEASFSNRMNSLSPRSQGSVAGLDGLFSPTLLNDINSSSIDYGFPTTNSPSMMSMSSHGANNNQIGRVSSIPRQLSASQSVSNTASPSASTVSHLGPLSSAGTSPEPTHNSPATKINGGFDVAIKTEAPKTPASTNLNDVSFDWLASQNGGNFDPVLFGDYRESQDAIVGGGDFSGGFFDDAVPEFESQFLNTGAEYLTPVSPARSNNLLDQVEKQKNADSTEVVEVVPADDKRSLLTCHKIWDKLQSCPEFQSGDFDVDSLCSELQQKAKCSETGVVVPKADVEAALWRLAGAPRGQTGKDNTATTS